MRRWLACVVLGWALVSGAQTRDADYAQRLETWALERIGGERDPSPEGKIIDHIWVESEDIVAPTDPWPGFVNLFHVKTRERVVRRELQVKEGDPWDLARIAESGRILRALGQSAPIFATALLVPVKSPEPGHVGLLVVTKDLWSIRLNSSYLFVGGILKQLRIRPSENNLLGRNKLLSLDLDLRQATFAAGQAYSDPRVFGSNLAFSESAGIIFERQSQRPEGAYASVSFTDPHYNLRDRWAGDVTLSYSGYRTRVFQGANILALPYPDKDNPTESILYRYDGRELAGSGYIERSFGGHHRQDVSLSLGAYSVRYVPAPELGLDVARTEWFRQNYLPRSENVTYVGARIAAYDLNYRVYKNWDSFALPEDFRLGYRLTARARLAPRLFSTASRFIEFGATARYAWDLGGDIFVVSAAGAIRHVPGAQGPGTSGDWVNQRAAFEVYNASPVIGFGRLVFRGMADLRWNDLDNRLLLLGGGNGLRGLPDGALTGTQALIFNTEYRTLPLEVLTVHLGLVFFWDAGSLFQQYGTPNITHSLGVGLRALFPQLDVEPIRIDFGYVINGPSLGLMDRWSSSFGQVPNIRPGLLSDPFDSRPSVYSSK